MTRRTQDKTSPDGEVLNVFDATAIVGLRVRVHNAAIKRVNAAGETDFELPQQRELLAAAAVSRCLLPIRLRGTEMRSIRKIMGLTSGELANKLGERTAAETVSRWENEKQPMGGYVEKTLRLLVCEDLKKQAPGVVYDAGTIAHMRVTDPWMLDNNFEVPYLEFSRVKTLREPGQAPTDTYMEAA